MSSTPKLKNIVNQKLIRPGLGQNFAQTVRVVVRKPKTPQVSPEDDEGPKDFKGKCAATSKAIYQTLGLKHFGFIFILVAYAFLGAVIFHLIEGPVERQSKEDLVRQLNQSARNLTRQILEANSSEEAILSSIHQYQKDSGLMPSENRLSQCSWDIWGAMLYASTLFTTIGYGHYAPATNAGRVATMIYALFGIPLVLATLADLGRLLTKILKRVWTYFVWIWRSCWNLCQRKKRISDEIESINSEEAEEFNLPIPIAIGLFIGWLVICAAIFCSWETRWSYFTAFYFFFISLSTIGTVEHINCCRPVGRVVCMRALGYSAIRGSIPSSGSDSSGLNCVE